MAHKGNMIATHTQGLADRLPRGGIRRIAQQTGMNRQTVRRVLNGETKFLTTENARIIVAARNIIAETESKLAGSEVANG